MAVKSRVTVPADQTPPGAIMDGRRKNGVKKQKPAKRQCKGTAKLTGKPCGSPPLLGQDYCGPHSGPEYTKMLREKSDASPKRPGVPRRPREFELLIKALEDHADAVVQQLLDIAQNAMKAVVVAGTKDEPGHVEMVPDHDVRLKALKELYDRVHGKPGQSVRIGGIDGAEPIAVDVPRGADRASKVAEILARQGALAKRAPTPHEGRQRREPTNGNGNGVPQT